MKSALSFQYFISSSLNILLITILITPASSYTCYAPDGLPVSDNIVVSHQPCKAPGLSTICCATSRNNPPGGNSTFGPTQDECMPNGLCQNRMSENGIEITTFWANYCTDQNFTGGNCLSICEQSRGSGKNTQVTSCNGKVDGERWCCGADNTACCESGIGAVDLSKIFVGIKGPSTTLSFLTRSSSIFGSTTGSSTSVPRSSATSRPARKESLDAGVVAGIVIGILATFGLLGTTIFFAARRSKIRKHRVPTHTQYQGSFAGSGTSTPLVHFQQGHENRPYNELSQENEKYELGHNKAWPHQAVELGDAPQELPTGLHPGLTRVPEVMLTTPRGTGHMFRSPI